MPPTFNFFLSSPKRAQFKYSGQLWYVNIMCNHKGYNHLVCCVYHPDLTKLMQRAEIIMPLIASSFSEMIKTEKTEK